MSNNRVAYRLACLVFPQSNVYIVEGSSMKASPVYRLISHSSLGYHVYPEIGYGIDDELAKATGTAYTAGQILAKPLGKNVRKVVVEFTDGSIIVAWSNGEGVIGIYVDPSRHVLQARQVPPQ